MDAIDVARVLLTQTVMSEVSKDVFRGGDAQMLGGLFGQILTDRLMQSEHRDG